MSVQAGSGTGTKSSPSGDRRFTYCDADGLVRAVRAAGFSIEVAEAAAPDPFTDWIAVHAVRSRGDR